MLVGMMLKHMALTVVGDAKLSLDLLSQNLNYVAPKNGFSCRMKIKWNKYVAKNVSAEIKTPTLKRLV